MGDLLCNYRTGISNLLHTFGLNADYFLRFSPKVWIFAEKRVLLQSKPKKNHVKS